MARKKIVSHRELDVYQRAFETSMEVFHLSKRFPKDATYSLTDQVRRSSRSVCANLAEAWRRRRYEAAFVSKLSDAETEAAETQVWIEFAVACEYLDRDAAAKLYRAHNRILATVVSMINSPEDWLLPQTRRR
jgi:four helix bundle protein